MIVFRAPETVTVVRPVLVESPYGGMVEDWGAVAEHPLTDCAIGPTVQAESHGPEGTRATDEMSLYCTNIDADVARGDRVRDARGQLWAVEGTPQRWRSPFTGDAFGTVARIALIPGGV